MMLGLAFKTSNFAGTDGTLFWGSSGLGCFPGVTYGFPGRRHCC
ncbi:hypothetical protein NKG05_17850 [Oerskovia sp. M15]